MSGDGLVDLSLFATSPADDRHFAVLNSPPPARNHRSQRDLSCPPSRTRATKPLPPLPMGRLCRKSPIRGRQDANSRCILMRIKRMRIDDRPRVTSPTIQQRRNTTPTPQLTLTVPPRRRNLTATPQLTLSRPPREEIEPGSSMVWMPDEQMWLIRTEPNREATDPCWGYSSPPARSPHRYTRSEPIPDSNSHLDLSPFSPIRNQFLSLIDSSDQGRLTPLFQEAVQTVPLTDISLASASLCGSNFEMEPDLPSDGSEYESYHTANSYRIFHSPTPEEPRIVFPQLAWESSWEGFDAEEEPMLVSPRAEWDGTTEVGSPENVSPPSASSPLVWERSWEAMGARLARPASALN